MKNKVMALLLLGGSFSTMADEPKTHLVVWAKDGAKVAYVLNENPKVTFTEEYLVITANGVEVNYRLENMARFTYESNNASAITNLRTGEWPFQMNNESLLFPALKANSTIAIYSLNGTLVFQKTIQKDGEYAFPLSNLDMGIYMVNINGLTYKIVKR